MGERVVIHVPGPDHFAADRAKKWKRYAEQIEREKGVAMSDGRGPIEVFFSEHGETAKRIGILEDGYIVDEHAFATSEEAKTYLMETLEFEETDANDHIAALEQLDRELMGIMARSDAIQRVTVSDKVWINRRRTKFVPKIFT